MAAAYTVEQTKEVCQLYQNGVPIPNIAEKLGRTTRSIITKLSKEGVYKNASKVIVGKRFTKSELISEIATMIGLNEDLVESLEKANLDVLLAIKSKLTELRTLEED